jgi:[ribosomal protein S5]-alanine N-acetyltransferase
MIHPFLIGDQIYLRPLEPGDARQITPWVNDPEVTCNLLIYKPMSLCQEEEYLQKRTKDGAVVLGIALRASDRLIGSAGLHDIDYKNGQCNFGILIGAKEEWGKGYGTQATRLFVDFAFRTLNLHRFWLHVYEYNVRAIRVYEKVGFQKEGTLRQARYHDGRYWDTHVMAILRHEWDARRS